MTLDLKSRIKDDGELTRSPAVRKLLEATNPEQDILPWSSVIALVDGAPDVRVPWYLRLALRGRRQLAYATVPGIVLVLLGVLWAMPAQSNYMGTIMTTGLPAAWTADSVEVEEVQAKALALFDKVKPSYGELIFKVTSGEDRPQLMLAMLGLDRASALELVEELESSYAALQAFEEDYTEISSDKYSSRFDELFSRLQRRLDGTSWNSTDELKLHVLSYLRQAGFENIQTEIIRKDDGRIFVEIDANFRIEVPGRTQEALEAAGMTEQALGSDAYGQLLRELGN